MAKRAEAEAELAGQGGEPAASQPAGSGERGASSELERLRYETYVKLTRDLEASHDEALAVLNLQFPLSRAVAGTKPLSPDEAAEA